MLAAGEGRQHGGNDGYDDQPVARYSWDDTVANHRAPKKRDIIVLWDGKTLLGASVIDDIEEGDGQKDRRRCPGCGRTSFKARNVARPRYRCFISECLLEFDTPDTETLSVHTYKTRHDAAWPT
jgi:ribosomal protein S27AE